MESTLSGSIYIVNSIGISGIVSASFMVAVVIVAKFIVKYE